MNKQDFLKIIKDPSLITSADSDKLEEVIANFPYCQAAHLLIAKIAHQNSSMLAKQKLNRAAAYVLERSRLKKIIQLKALPAEPAEPAEPAVVAALPATRNTTVENKVFPPVKSEIKKIEEIGHSKKAEDIDEVKDAVNAPVQPSIQKNEVFTNPADSLIPKEIIKINNLGLPDVNSEIKFADKIKNDLEVKSTFFRELEQNLENLKRLKEKNELKKFVEFEEVQETKQEVIQEKKQEVIEETKQEVIQDAKQEVLVEPDKTQKEEPAEDPVITMPILSIENRGSSSVSPDTRFIIYSSRLEDILVQQQDATYENTSQELLFDYITFLANRKKSLFRSREKVNSIIEKFISEEPSIPYASMDDPTENVEDLSEDSTRISNHIASENFAKILVRQGKYKKAISIYNELILKYPEKKAYFAFQIQALNNKIQ